MSSFPDSVNQLAAAWGNGLVTVLWQSSLLAAAVFLVTRFLRRAPASVRFWLWMLIPLRLLVMPVVGVSLPVLPTSPEPAVREKTSAGRIPADQIGIARVGAPRSDGAAVARSGGSRGAAGKASVPGTVSPGFNAWSWLMAFWCLGAVFFALRLAASWLKARRLLLRAAAPPEAGIVEAAARAAGLVSLSRAPRVLISHDAKAPLVLGFFHPAVVLPAALAGRLPRDGLLGVLIHECAHLRRRDLLTGWIVAIAEVVYFFHPFFHLARRYILMERENACDETVLATRATPPHSYADALLATAQSCTGARSRIGPMAVAAESFTHLKRRISRIAADPFPTARISRLTLGALVLLTASCLPGVTLTTREADGFPVTVQVTGEDGSFVPGAAVEAIADWRSISTARTDAKGRATVRIPGGVDFQWVIGLKPGRGFDYFNVKKFPGDTAIDPAAYGTVLPETVTLCLKRDRTVRIRAVDSEGSPVPGVRLVPWVLRKDGKVSHVNLSGSEIAASVTDGKGLAVFDWLCNDTIPRPLGGMFLLQTDDDHWPLQDSGTGEGEGGAGTITARLLRAGTIRGTVLHGDGRPAAGIRVQVEGRGKTIHFCRKHALTGSDGSYAIKIYPAQSYLVAVLDDTWTAPTRTGIVIGEGEVREGVDFRLEAGKHIEGRVTLKDRGDPAPGVLVFLRYEGAELPEAVRPELPPPDGELVIDSAREALIISTRTDREGRYDFRVPRGEYRLAGAGTERASATHSRGGTRWATARAGDRVDLEYTLDDLKLGGITASLVKANQGEPFEVAPMRRLSGANKSAECLFCHIPR